MLIAVVGDFMLDHSVHAKHHKIANEQPVPVLLVERETWTLGGAGNLARNLHALGAQLITFGRAGLEREGDLLVQQLGAISDCRLVRRGITTIKHRVYTGNYLQCRYDTEQPEVSDLLDEMIQVLKDKPLDLMVFSDYNKGALSTPLVRALIQFCQERGIPTAADPKSLAFRGATLIKPNLAEASHLLGFAVGLDELPKAHAHLRERLDCTYSLITLSEHGLSLGSAGGILTVPITQGYQLCDVTGAGDVVMALVAYQLAAGKPLDDEFLRRVVMLATKSVQHLGAYCLSPLDLCRRLTFRELPELRKLATARHQTIVFSNGCFDLLHAGHVSSLQFAKSHGDLLVVGLNSDASVAALKPGRPIQTQQHRAQMLESLHCVDHVCIFDQDSPAELLSLLKPDVMIKGDEYAGKPIIGREHVGRVVLAPMVAHLSTTKILESARARLG